MLENWESTITEIASVLKQRYHDFDHYNRKDPLEELLFIVCSIKTTETNYLRTFAELQRNFPVPEMLADATIEEFAKVLTIGGLANQKARLIKQFIDKIVARFGRVSLDPLNQFSNAECEEFLLSLPGAGKKVARCVMMYSLGRQVFPVDTHVCRICARLGLGQPSRSDNACSQKDMDRLQDFIPPDLRFSLHVNMISLGREICTPRQPKCEICPINIYCPKIGVVKNNQPI